MKVHSAETGTGADDASRIQLIATDADGFARTIEIGVLNVVLDARLANLSARAQARSGAASLIAGFVTASASGPAGNSILIRGLGPALSQPPFNVAGALSDAQLALFDGAGAARATNSRWDASLAPVFARIGAFPLPVGSADAALLASVAPGAYTAQVSSDDETTGLALIELYDVR